MNNKVPKILFVVFLFISCDSGFYLPISGFTPKKKSFKYYDRNFVLPDDTKLRVNEHYICLYENPGRNEISVNLLTFFDDGLVNSWSTSLEGLEFYLERQIEYPKNIRRDETAGPFGYFGIEKDSVFFTMKAHYRMEFPWKGYAIIYSEGDSLFVSESSKDHVFAKRRSFIKKYVLLSKSKFMDILNDQ